MGMETNLERRYFGIDHSYYQFSVLENEFSTYKYLTRRESIQLGRILGLTPRQVRIWFYYRRIIWRSDHLRSRNDLHIDRTADTEADDHRLTNVQIIV
ncbi:hypothetical protein I4U23_004962 [Adineta vaga]|nr:hypothetical protein I4U23_004962 [Adineta vaga]